MSKTLSQKKIKKMEKTAQISMIRFSGDLSMDENEGPRLLAAPRSRGQRVDDEEAPIIPLPGPAGPVAIVEHRHVRILDDENSDPEAGG